METVTQVPRYYGVYRAVVTDTNDSKKIVRVKTRVPELTGGLATAWAPIASPYGGPKVGFVAVPPVGTTVTVQFEAGDVNRPIVTGMLWNDDASNPQIPDAATKKDTTARGTRGTDQAALALGGVMKEPADPAAPSYPSNKVWRTANHLIELDDTSGKERLNITNSKSGSWLELHPDGALVIGVKGVQYVLVEKDSALHVKGKHDVVVEGNATFKCADQKTQMGKWTGQFRELLWRMSKFVIEAVGVARVKAPIVQLGPGQWAPVVTTKTHPVDYITGIPIQGEPSVQAG